MKLQHHLGGIENLGPVSTGTRVFVEPWEKRIFRRRLQINPAEYRERFRSSNASSRTGVSTVPAETHPADSASRALNTSLKARTLAEA
ncbi:SH3-like domain-containing protein [Paraburkholderia aromaticivorans]|uniref:SH3-like domain-containing protein n=1 Tax=Paraburkholderia aromaticivorans TaxID=2026199 RepID=UPI001456008D|nr:SH3-like domain-containing protein [Paraburkholderia aromaticivorans]